MMGSCVLAIAWSLFSRHRLGFGLAAMLFVALAVSFPLLVAITPPGAMIVTSLAPLVGIFAFVLNSLLLVEDAGSLTSRYPRFMLTLPVKTGWLAFWPMMLVSVGSGLLWVAAALLIYRPAGYETPILLPSLALAGLMAWAQALAWMPIRVFWVREFSTILLAMILGCLGALPLWLMFRGAGSTSLAALVLLTYTAIAFLVGWAAVASDRQGLAWRFWPAQTTAARFARPERPARAKRPFRSAFDAQLSYEWGCHGLMLNGFVGALLFWIWGVLLLRRRHGTPTELALILTILTITVVATIAASGIAFGRFGPFWNHQRGLAQRNTFIATRPMTSARLVAAKYRMAAASVIANWILAVIGTIGWLVVSDERDNVEVLAREFFSRYPGGKGFAVIALSCILLPALSWRFLTGSLVPVLTGRRWVADGAIWLYLSFLAVLGGCGFWIAKLTPEQLARLYPAIPFLVLVIVTIKGAAALAGFHAALERGLMSWWNIAGVLGLWFVLSTCGFTLAILLGPNFSLPVSLPILALSVAALIPLARFPLATLALDWNRHR